MPHTSHIMCADVRSSNRVGSGSSVIKLGAAPPSRNILQATEQALTDDILGVMAPCWRLLEREKTYMDKVMT